MVFHARASGGLDYDPCHYGESRIAFRGPKRPLKDKFIAFLGGTETYGRFVRQPFPDLLERDLGLTCLNLGVVNAGLDLYLNDPEVLDIARQANLRVLQIVGAQNMSNRFYQVHPRRNDRFLRASERLVALYPEVDFTEFHFNGHMLGHLVRTSEERFQSVIEELRTAWVARMKHLLTVLRGPTVVIWMADHAVPHALAGGLGEPPLFVTREMMDALRPRSTGVLEIVVPRRTAEDECGGMVFADSEASAAALAPGPRAHGMVRDALLPILAPLLRRDAA